MKMRAVPISIDGRRALRKTRHEFYAMSGKSGLLCPETGQERVGFGGQR
jgi:hypothetical protein